MGSERTPIPWRNPGGREGGKIKAKMGAEKKSILTGISSQRRVRKRSRRWGNCGVPEIQQESQDERMFGGHNIIYSEAVTAVCRGRKRVHCFWDFQCSNAGDNWGEV